MYGELGLVDLVGVAGSGKVEDVEAARSKFVQVDPNFDDLDLLPTDPIKA